MPALSKDHLKEIFVPMIGWGETIPSDSLLKALAKTSGKSVADLRLMYEDLSVQMDKDGNPFAPVPPIRG